MDEVFQRTVRNELVAKFRRQIRRDFLYWVPGCSSQFDAQQICDKLWLGSLRAVFDKSSLVQNDIKYALTVAADMVEFFPRSSSGGSSPPSIAHDIFPMIETTEREDTGFEEHAVVHIYDSSSENILEKLEPALSFLDHCLLNPTNSGGVLVHCAAGVSRSTSVVLAYLMTRKGMSLADALQFVRKVRPIVSPNPGFLDQLKVLEECSGNISEANDTYRRRRASLEEKRKSTLFMLSDIV
jgi:protein-tyrosine phosphatase